jgi:serine O-acetyltransferase
MPAYPHCLRSLRYFWRADLYRYEGRADLVTFLRHFLIVPGYRYTVVWRLGQYASAQRRNPVASVLRFVVRAVLANWQLTYGIELPIATQVGAGLFIGHPGSIVIHPRARIGRNCNISQGVTLSQANRGPRKGYPVVGDDVYIGPGAVLVGAVRVGNNVAIGANCVVTKDMPDDAVVVGVPGRVISDAGAAGYVEHTNYRSC